MFLDDIELEWCTELVDGDDGEQVKRTERSCKSRSWFWSGRKGEGDAGDAKEEEDERGRIDWNRCRSSISFATVTAWHNIM